LTIIAEFLIFLAVCGLSYADSTANPCDGKPNGSFVNDETSCEGYFACYNGVANPKKCPEGLHFIEEKQMCDFPTETSCIYCPGEDIPSRKPLIYPNSYFLLKITSPGCNCEVN
jgi:hypothetical protein